MRRVIYCCYMHYCSTNWSLLRRCRTLPPLRPCFISVLHHGERRDPGHGAVRYGIYSHRQGHGRVGCGEVRPSHQGLGGALSAGGRLAPGGVESPQRCGAQGKATAHNVSCHLRPTEGQKRGERRGGGEGEGGVQLRIEGSAVATTAIEC